MATTDIDFTPEERNAVLRLLRASHGEDLHLTAARDKLIRQTGWKLGTYMQDLTHPLEDMRATQERMEKDGFESWAADLAVLLTQIEELQRHGRSAARAGGKSNA